MEQKQYELTEQELHKVQEIQKELLGKYWNRAGELKETLGIE